MDRVKPESHFSPVQEDSAVNRLVCSLCIFLEPCVDPLGQMSTVLSLVYSDIWRSCQKTQY